MKGYSFHTNTLSFSRTNPTDNHDCGTILYCAHWNWAYTYVFILATPLSVLARCRSPGDLSQGVVSYEFGTSQATSDPSVLSNTYIDVVQSLAPGDRFF